MRPTIILFSFVLTACAAADRPRTVVVPVYADCGVDSDCVAVDDDPLATGCCGSCVPPAVVTRVRAAEIASVAAIRAAECAAARAVVGDDFCTTPECPDLRPVDPACIGGMCVARVDQPSR